MLLERDDIQPNAASNGGSTPLIFASRNGNEGIAKLLLEREDIQPNAADKDGFTPLIWASKKGHKGIVQMLLERDDIQPNAADKGGLTPLIFASQNGHEGIVKMLLERDDIQPNAADKGGSTPLTRALWNGNERIVKLLLEPGRTGTIQKPSISHGNYWPEKHGLTIVDTSHYKLEYRIQNDQEQILTHTTAIRKTSPGYQTLFVPMGRYKNLPPTCMCRQLAVGTVCSVGQGFGRPLYGVQEGYGLNFDVWDDG
ncbi:ankyrin repeat-containing domain protein [Coprinopsis sp. MPI-PUGE-AT-0042]|nr:ankyrin repeat-containing domain protein [Coprinopsis sp. MPI-PUGE-AT-0042]